MLAQLLWNKLESLIWWQTFAIKYNLNQYVINKIVTSIGTNWANRRLISISNKQKYSINIKHVTIIQVQLNTRLRSSRGH